MVIRCERCSTLYELDEALLAPGGSQVQCTRCQHVFTAFPPRAPGRTLV
ncbi:MAG TPA: zinc-ribbon domain-containing protein, partial [Anaeromyxobacter sp.]|nr:zinc-ribbon domain-containing protein [Anaeromyxobacter sp.]